MAMNIAWNAGLKVISGKFTTTRWLLLWLAGVQIYEEKNNFTEAVSVYKKIISMNVEESKFAEERVNLIKQRIK